MNTMTSSPNRWIRRTSTGSVLLVAAIAAVVSFRHMHELALSHGESPLTAALIPLSVDGTVVSSSMALLLESRYGRRGGVLPWTLLITASLTSLAANVAVAEPTLVGRVIAAWPSFALVGAYEILMRQIRHAYLHHEETIGAVAVDPAALGDDSPVSASREDPAKDALLGPREGREVQRAAWIWALANRGPDGSLPSGRVISQKFGRSSRWGRLVKSAGLSGQLDPACISGPLQSP
ncbi:DUF2637 domain-containing protein [Microbispora sp. H10830]|uniref:DUF2637 domain-containing protein n=1 Tax=Microbispora sp. H10830 TaxID=2729109 RepID=UPI001603C0B7|nr:DUF2637 domain-containing protein [Microbispora sp. H10830]